jgi:predicted acylesterase/phospholipase RssA
MIIKTEGRKAPVNPVAYMPGGGKHGYGSIRTMAAVSQLAGIPLRKLFFGGFVGSSVGAIPAAAAAAGAMKMHNLAELFLRELPFFLAHTTRNKYIHPMQAITDTGKMLLSSVFNIQYQSQTQLYDRTYMEQVIRQHFGHIKFLDLQHNLFITSHKIGPGREEPFDFYATPKGIKDGSILTKENITLDVSLADAILAATAIPTVFPCYKVEETGTLHIDTAQVDTALSQMSSLAMSQQNGLDMGLVQFDTFLHNIAITEKEYNSQGFARQIANQRLIDSPAVHTKINARNHVRNALGKENYHLLEISNAELAKLPFNMDMLDTSKKELKNLKEGMDDYIERDPGDQIKRATDFLVENLEIYRANNMDSSFCGPTQKAAVPFNMAAIDFSSEAETAQLREDIMEHLGEDVDEKTLQTINFLITAASDNNTPDSALSSFLKLFSNNKKTTPPSPSNPPEDHKPS